MTTEWYAERKKWTLGRVSVVVEGNLDPRYFQLADRLHQARAGRTLLGPEFRVLSSGTGDAGGADGVVREFLTLFNLAQVDLDGNGKKKFRVAALFDDDLAGRTRATHLLKANRMLKMGRDVFLLWRQWPLLQLAPEHVQPRLQAANAEFQSLPCEMEDLLSTSLIDTFLGESAQHFRPRRTVAGAHHIDWTDDGKHALLRFAETHAAPDDGLALVSMVIGLRHYLGVRT